MSKDDVDPYLLSVMGQEGVGGGNPGAISLLMRVFTTFKPVVFPCFVYDLANRGLKGPGIWYLYKDIHHEDFMEFCKDVWTGGDLEQMLKVEGGGETV